MELGYWNRIGPGGQGGLVGWIPGDSSSSYSSSIKSDFILGNSDIYFFGVNYKIKNK